MADTPYIAIRLNGETLHIPQTKDLPISLNFEIEDEDDFRQKKAGTSLNISVPATTNNSSKLNTLFNPGAEDLLPDEGFDKPLDMVIIGAGQELMKGKAFVLGAKKLGGKPLSFDINCFGDNADWVIPNKELTLHDVVNPNTHIFDKATIENSWQHDGTDENRDYVYAPARYREAFGRVGITKGDDIFLRPEDMKPSLFIYWLLYRGFKKAGYKIDSKFFDTDYFRRLVLPWTWGNFLNPNAAIINDMRFKAMCVGNFFFQTFGANITTPFIADIANGLDMSNDNITPGFDTLNTYTYMPGGIMEWIYPVAYANIGLLTVGFNLSFGWKVALNWNHSAQLDVEWWQDNGSGYVLQSTIPNVVNESGGLTSTNNNTGVVNLFFETTTPVIPGGKIKVVIKGSVSHGNLAGSGASISVGNFNASGVINDCFFELTYFKIPIGGTIDMKLIEALKKVKWLDLLRGTIDTFNLQMNTDAVTKTVTLEPTHNYSLDDNLGNNTNQGFYNGNVLDWTTKEDISKISEVSIYQDYEKEVLMQMAEDTNDGILKLVQDRYKIIISQSKYVFSERFKKGDKEIPNRFFGATMHYNHEPWKKITGIVPQLICLVPENVSNTSNTESESTFKPKIAWFKGMVDKATYGGWNWDGDTAQDLPFMFATNYKIGGENDPILTYCDQRISDGASGFVIGKGLFKRFFWQRFAIMRHGKIYKANFLLNNTDVTSYLHREFKAIAGQRYQLTAINGYKPLLNESTECKLWKWYPVTQADADNTYPSNASVINGTALTNTPDIKYYPAICSYSQIPL
jgi:hypothetical protein